MWDRLLVDCNIATLEAARGDPLGVIENGAIGIADGRIVRVGKRTELAGYRAKKVDALGGAWVTPGLIDCHTHLVFAGNRAGGACDAPRRRQLRGDRQGRRRHRLDRGQDQGRVRRRASRAKSAPPPCADGRRLHDRRGQVRLRARPRRRAAAARDRPAAGRGRSGADRSDPARAPRAPRRQQGPPRSLCRRNGRQIDPEGGERRLWPAPSTLIARPSVSPPTRSSGCSRRPPGTAFGSSSTPSNSPTSTAPSLPRNIARCRPITSSISTKPAPPRWPTLEPSPCSCPALSMRCRKLPSRRSTCCASTRCRSPSPPTATPAPRRCSRRPWR